LTCAKRKRTTRARWLGLLALSTAAIGLAPAHASASSGGVGPGGVGTTPPAPGTTTPGPTAKLKNGYAIPPASAPRKVQRAIYAANEIVKGKPYCLGGGHARRRDTCYDCSGSVSYALTGAGLLDYSMPSGSFMKWGGPGRGQWISLFANEGHIYAVIAGLRLDTSMTDGDGPGWSDVMRSAKGYAIRHPVGF
jgi:cell wall-associated NlpC family hydrolase